MKGLILLFASVLLTLNAICQDRKISPAKVDKVLNVPVYLYSYPSQEYEELETLNATWSAVATGLEQRNGISVRTKEIINKAKNKMNKGNVSTFNAIIINPDDYTGILISLSDKSTLNAEVNRILGVPVYIYSYPTQEYIEVKEITAGWSAVSGSNLLDDQISEIILNAKRKEQKGKIDKFDAIIIDPDNFTGILIRFIEKS